MKTFKFLTPLLISLLTMLHVSCDEDAYYEPKNYPRKMIFKGNVSNSELVPIENIRIVLVTPDNTQNDAVYSDPQGFWEIKRTLDFAGPNKMFVRDIDGQLNGGAFAPFDTIFYITGNQYDSNLVEIDFKLLN